MQWTGRDLRAERPRAGLTQAELGRLIGVSARRVASVESQYRVSTAFVDRVQRALGITRQHLCPVCGGAAQDPRGKQLERFHREP